MIRYHNGPYQIKDPNYCWICKMRFRSLSKVINVQTNNKIKIKWYNQMRLE